MLKKIVFALLAAVVAVLGYATTRPDSYTVERKITVNAPVEKIYVNLVSFKRWDAWSPWVKRDPTMLTTFSGAESGVGAKYAWKGNSDVGEGKMEITDVSPNRVAVKLDFIKPFENLGNVATFSLVPNGVSTDVTWTMKAPRHLYRR